eukprot:scaffold241187_cov21-Tisochrysis_lutea.AAC.1
MTKLRKGPIQPEQVLGDRGAPYPRRALQRAEPAAAKEAEAIAKVPAGGAEAAMGVVRAEAAMAPVKVEAAMRAEVAMAAVRAA